MQKRALLQSVRHFSDVGTTSARALRRPRDVGAMLAAALQSVSVQDSCSTTHSTRVATGMPSKTPSGQFYQRQLPHGHIPFSSESGRKLFKEAMAGGCIEGYFYLAEQFQTQDEPTFCGLATLAMVLNALRIDPMRAWKGAWRWFTERNLLCSCTQPDGLEERGLTMDLFAKLASCNGASATVLRPPAECDSTQLEKYTKLFRAAVRATLRSPDREFIVAAYSRQALRQTGGGHFSPIGAYHEESDSVLIMDVARFKYPPHWAPLEEVVRAMLHVDPDTGKPRGYVHLRAHPRVEEKEHASIPLHVRFVSKAAGQRLSQSLLDMLSPGRLQAPEGLDCSSKAIWRWLRAVESAELRILGNIFSIRSASLFSEMLASIHAKSPLFQRLCESYAELHRLGVAGSFPPLAFNFADRENKQSLSLNQEHEELSLENCGEAWVLFLLLLPQHLRAAVSELLAAEGLSEELCRAIRCPWALPMASLCKALQLALPPVQAQCG